MLYQLSYTPKSTCRKAGAVWRAPHRDKNSLEPEAGSLTATPCRRKAIQAAACLRFSLSIAFTVDPATGLEKI